MREITRVKRYYKDVVPRYMPDEFRSHFRLSRETFENLCARIANCAEFRKLTGPTLYTLRNLFTCGTSI